MELHNFNNKQTISSREIAELTEKIHKNVLADCDKLNEYYKKMGLAEISADYYKDDRNRNQREYHLSKMQSMDLLTGYKIELRIKVNRRWEELENNEQNSQIDVYKDDPFIQLRIGQINLENEVRDIKKMGENNSDEIKEIKAQITTRPNYFTVVGYATLNKIECGIKLASSMGRKASQYCKQKGIPTESIPDPRFGLVKTYPYNVLQIIFNLPINNI